MIGSRLPVVRDSFERPDLCGPCGGKCCKRAPGAAFPEDFGAPDRAAVAVALKARLATGRWAVDWWEGDPTGGDRGHAYYLRPAIVGKEGQHQDAGWGGACTFLSGAGCTIAAERPSGCRGLEPKADQFCEDRYGGKKEACIAWIPYEDLIDAALAELGP